MNEKLKQSARRTGENLLPIAVFVTVLICAVAAGVTFDIIDFDSNTSTNQTLENNTDLNMSKYYDNQTQICRSPKINQTNASQLKACVSNQTSVS